MNQNKNKKNNYQSPITEVYEIEIEQVLCGSPGTWDMEDLGNENDPIGW